MAASADLTERLWRVRKRHDHIDAVLHEARGGWELQFGCNDRPLVIWHFDAQDDARREAAMRLKELQRAGWTTHW